MHPPPQKKRKVKKCDRGELALLFLIIGGYLIISFICFKQDDLSVFGPFGKKWPYSLLDLCCGKFVNIIYAAVWDLLPGEENVEHCFPRIRRTGLFYEDLAACYSLESPKFKR